jgi:hypothetical protein
MVVKYFKEEEIIGNILEILEILKNLFVYFEQLKPTFIQLTGFDNILKNCFDIFFRYQSLEMCSP